jgi:RND family efflux transporter MFP subunit
MHPTMISDKPGDCPICGMRMVPMEEKEQTPPEGGVPPGAPATGKKVIYRSTMNPGEVSDRPGKDSMGMEMERVEMEEGTSPAAGVEGRATVGIPTRKQQLIGVRTEPVKRIPFIRTIRTVGRVAVDETRFHHVHTKVEGWVEDLHVNATGQRVARGESLLSLYSPEILATQEEYLLALRSRRALGEGALPEAVKGADEMVESGRRRLSLYDLTAAQIEALEKTGRPSRTVEIYSPASGYVLMRNVSHGEKITPDMNLLDIADLSRVWVIASVYEYELPYVKAGQQATMTLSYLPGKAYTGRVVLIYPVLEAASRTAQVRLEFENREMDLKPEMYADVELHGDMGTRLAIPESALIASGTRNVVFVSQGDGYFQPREVRLGLRLDDVVEILEGLGEGETVVTSGNFLIDSESRMKAALESVGPPAQERTEGAEAPEPASTAKPPEGAAPPKEP